MADALLLASQKVLPTKLLGSGYTFLRPGLEDALKFALRKNQSSGAGK
jgi:NAD dependent epimerase/dehydratase family enzyme